MKIALRPSPRLPQVPWWLCALAAVWAMTALSSVCFTSAAQGERSLCHVRQLTGVACPTCGSTRATVKVVTADPIGGFRENPLVMTAAFFIAGVLAVRFVLARQVTLQMNSREQAVVALLLIAIVAVNWIYVLHRHGGSLLAN